MADVLLTQTGKKTMPNKKHAWQTAHTRKHVSSAYKTYCPLLYGEALEARKP